MRLAVKDLGKHYGEQVLFSDLNFAVTNDDWLTVIGESGSGKSTLLKIIAGLVDASTGLVLLNDKEEWTYPVDEYRQRVSYATQAAQLFGETVRDNLDLPFLVRKQEPDVKRQVALLEQVELPADFLDRNIHDLSGGQRQRVGVARNLIFAPDVLLLDEISTGLDADTKAAIWHLVEHMQAKAHFAVLSVTHDAQEIKSAKWTLKIEDGRGVLS
ncbi:ABC transporter ATP-binding protein [Weissella halotolerans]|uniref:ABC transporter, ATP-binding protein n=1 Tax=Weissella halotolerans DSM 20190 TaxID=1123500 RepID=A0A0R2G8C3_9LACO|nr:ATP-binding cassette domain-containing protein [Weissella halotolerans]KRN33434.1 ABC transporter, ATP-binding protein [Weissella halotolerans DSM 20190]